MKEGFYAVGRRKKATAKVRVKSGQGNLTVNKRELENYFSRKVYSKIVKEPLEKVNFLDKFDVEAHVKGGGPTGQAEAIRLGLSRAILKINPELRNPLKKAGLLTRNPKVKERKKPGLRAARARPQISKR
jgi:small subunit ribosomal protein S9